VLHREKHTGGIDQINDRERAFEGDSLGTNQFLRGLGKEGTCFYSGIIGDNHAGDARNRANASHGTRSWDTAPLFVHLVSSPEPDFEKIILAIEQMSDAFTRRKPSHFPLSILANLAAAFTQERFFLQNRFTSCEEGVAGGGIGTGSHRVVLLRRVEPI